MITCKKTRHIFECVPGVGLCAVTKDWYWGRIHLARKTIYRDLDNSIHAECCIGNSALIERDRPWPRNREKDKPSSRIQTKSTLLASLLRTSKSSQTETKLLTV